ncbi:ATP-grasp domain-containing protein [Streptomyces iconiensis]|uniref:ATP-grasp domain-containing protein n=1 Tax=Streptomyces iconiensis TaxID=1384038 RepID=A0ABT7A0C7_9ACTN|nr:ATP-grasp domain-containing protein [Streptomyces iconiensis]MDJ1134783.1 ATP-grasp domain-containing protein [Streptomyces iconiensis]
MSESKPAVVLLDPVRTGEGFKSAARDKGYAAVSVYSLDARILKNDWPDHALTDDLTLYGADADTVVSQLAAADYDLKAVVPANEAAVHLADVVAERLGLPGNEAALAWSRRNKSAMRARAHEVGLRIPRFRLVHDLSEVPKAGEETGYPAIVKPTMSAGAHGATLVPDRAAAENLAIAETRDVYGHLIEEWLVEEYIRGREFAVNCFSSDGEHRVMDMWEYRQPDDRDYDFPVYDNVQVEPDDPDWQRAESYVKEVLTTYGLRRGPSHTEVKCNADGVYLMEINARLPGGPATGQWLKHTSIRPFHDTIDCFLGVQPAIMEGPLDFRARFGAIAIRNDEAPGTLVAVHGLDELREYPGVDTVLVSYEPGDTVPVTSGMTNIPVGAYISGATQREVVDRLAGIRALVSLEIDHGEPAGSAPVPALSPVRDDA